MTKSIFTLGAIALGVTVQAQQINSRIDLNSMLTSSVTDDFEAYNIADGNAEFGGQTNLDSSSIINGQGPNLVNSGVIYSAMTNDLIQWNGNGYFGLNTKTFLVATAVMGISFGPAVDAFGLDAKSFEGFGYNGTMSVYNDSTLLGTVNFSVDGAAGSSTFLGWFSSTGITFVSFQDNDHGFSPIIDDHTFGEATAVPEPASMTALALGGLALLRRRKSK